MISGVTVKEGSTKLNCSDTAFLQGTFRMILMILTSQITFFRLDKMYLPKYNITNQLSPKILIAQHKNVCADTNPHRYSS